MAKKILIIDDEAKIVEICQDYLKAAGFQVVTSLDGSAGLEKARIEKPDLVLLDLMLPGIDGLDICRELRRDTKIPIIMLTARVEETDKLIGLEIGADDYITKPFSPREMVARVRAVLRRVQGDAAAEIIRAGNITLDRNRFNVLINDQEISLTPTEFEILATLASQPGRIFSRSQLLLAVRGVTFESYERAIDSHIRNLRKKLDFDGIGAEWIVTIHGVGYKFNERAND